MCREIPRLQSKANPDIPAHLADPHGVTLQLQRSSPQPQMHAFVNTIPCPL